MIEGWRPNGYEKQIVTIPMGGYFESTYAIGLTFVFLAYVLHPAVAANFRRIRAYRGWRAVENGQTVEVTTYSLVEEICGGRGKWDAGRVVTVLLAAFSLASWGLELHLGLAFFDGLVTDVFFRPPPVWTTENNAIWNVIPPGDLDIEFNEEMPSMSGTFFGGTAKAIYKVSESDDIIRGAVKVASWSNSSDGLTTNLPYDDANGFSCVESEEYSEDDTIKLYVRGEPEPWGEVLDCNKGRDKETGTSSSHALNITSAEGETYFIVEESITYPSFLYSVWKQVKSNETAKMTELHHVFHISSSARLAEAVVTEIVHASYRSGNSRQPTGGGAFALLRAFSENNSTYDANISNHRASPFGEHPVGEGPKLQLSSMDTIEKGVTLNIIALLCAVLIIALTLVSIVWSLVLRSRIGMDIYDRDDLIRAVTSPAAVNDEDHLPKIRIFVRKEENGNISVAVSEVEGRQSGCPQSFRRHETVAVDDPVPVSRPSRDYGFGDAVVPPGTCTVWLEGVRTGRARVYPGREGNYRYPTTIALVASPARSRVGSTAETPAAVMNSPADVPQTSRSLTALDPRLFDSVNSLGESEGHDGDVELGRFNDTGEQENEPHKRGGPPSQSPSESRKTEIIDQWKLPFHSSDSSASLKGIIMSTSPNGGQTPMTSGSSTRSRRPTADPEETKNNSTSQSETEEEYETEYAGMHDSVRSFVEELV